MDWKTIGNYVLLGGLFVAIFTMFNQVNDRFDRLQAETNRRFDQVFDRMDRMEAQSNGRFDSVNGRFDAMQVENNRQHDDLNRRFDEMFEVLRAFEGRISHLEGRLDVPGAEAAE